MISRPSRFALYALMYSFLILHIITPVTGTRVPVMLYIVVFFTIVLAIAVDVMTTLNRPVSSFRDGVRESTEPSEERRIRDVRESYIDGEITEIELAKRMDRIIESEQTEDTETWIDIELRKERESNQ